MPHLGLGKPNVLPMILVQNIQIIDALSAGIRPDVWINNKNPIFRDIIITAINAWQETFPRGKICNEY